MIAPKRATACDACVGRNYADPNADEHEVCNDNATMPFFFLVMLTLAATSVVEPAQTRVVASLTSSDSERVFVPVVVSNLPGAAGSVWQTTLWVTNISNQPIVYYFVPCSQACCCNETNTIAAQSTSTRGDNRPAGRWAEMPASGAIRIEARLRDLSRNASSAGIALPILRESDFRSDEVNLIAVPRDPAFRVTLRIYCLDSSSLVTVEQIDQNGQLLRIDSVPLTPPASGDYSLLTAYAQLGLDAASQPSTPIRLRIRPAASGAHIWALASVTNNATSEVTLIQPARP
jgi:hypothetical protein